MGAKGSHHVRCSDERISTVQVSNLHLQFATSLEKAKREYALWVLAEEYEEEDR